MLQFKQPLKDFRQRFGVWPQWRVTVKYAEQFDGRNTFFLGRKNVSVKILMWRDPKMSFR